MNKILIVLCLFFSLQLIAQEGYQMQGNKKFVEIDILASYYDQDGNNGAVTGGIGTEALTDLSQMIIVNIPIDSTRSIQASFGADIYTSASTDNIDNNKSSASSQDTRAYGNLGYTKKILSKGLTYGGRLGFSNEYDYTSFSLGLNMAKEFNEGNTEVSASSQLFIDQWRPYYPIELRGDVSVPTTSRNSYNGQITLAQVVNKRMQIAFSAEAIYMQGLLSTPFHRVYFEGQPKAVLENLPNSRLKLPFSLRATIFASQNIVIRSYYRYYMDDFGITAHTASLELPIKINGAWTLAPFYRFHTQTGADYFAPYERHNQEATYFTSDYDLSALSSQKYGLAVGYAPIYGLSRAKIPLTNRIFMLEKIQLRGSYYTRDTGLEAFSFALEIGMHF